jgi:glycosyltransferase involved in cell wall biosynthesis
MVTLSICILVGRGDDNIERLVSTIVHDETYPYDVMLVVDENYRGQSFDGGIFKSFPVPVKILRYCGGKKQPAMRNMAVVNCTSDFIWFIDDDVSLKCDTIKRIFDELDVLSRNNQIACVAGKINEEISYDPNDLPYPVGLHPYKGTIGYFGCNYSKFDSVNYKYITIGGLSRPIISFAQGTSMVFSVAVLKKIGGFNEDLSNQYATYEDSEPSLLMFKYGYFTVFSSEFPIVHHKMARLSGVGRTNGDIQYNKSIIDNHIISLVQNRYPTALKSLFYSQSFGFYHMLRMLSEKHTVYTKFSLFLTQPFINIKTMLLALVRGRNKWI